MDAGAQAQSASEHQQRKGPAVRFHEGTVQRSAFWCLTRMCSERNGCMQHSDMPQCSGGHPQHQQRTVNRSTLR